MDALRVSITMSLYLWSKPTFLSASARREGSPLRKGPKLVLRKRICVNSKAWPYGVESGHYVGSPKAPNVYWQLLLTDLTNFVDSARNKKVGDFNAYSFFGKTLRIAYQRLDAQLTSLHPDLPEPLREMLMLLPLLALKPKPIEIHSQP